MSIIHHVLNPKEGRPAGSSNELQFTIIENENAFEVGKAVFPKELLGEIYSTADEDIRDKSDFAKLIALLSYTDTIANSKPKKDAPIYVNKTIPIMKDFARELQIRHPLDQAAFNMVMHLNPPKEVVIQS